jgi:hypothetical protein
MLILVSGSLLAPEWVHGMRGLSDRSSGLRTDAGSVAGPVLSPDMTVARLTGRVVGGSAGPGFSFFGRRDRLVLVRVFAEARRSAARRW